MAIVTSVTAIGDLPITIASPSARTVTVDTNGRVLKIVTSGTNVTGDVDLTKITATVTDKGFDTAGNATTVTRTIRMRDHLRGPWAEDGYYQPVAGTFHLVVASPILNQDGTNKTTFVSVDFAAGWVSGAVAESITSVTRLDSKVYPATPIKVLSHPWDRMAPGEAYALEVVAVSKWARNRQQVACVEAWGVDSAATVGTVVRQGVQDRSPSTPASGNVAPGLRADTYALNVPMTGLVQGRVGIRITVKPWIGPAVSSFGYGDTFPSQNLCAEIPVIYDTDGSQAPVYGVIAHDPASPPAGKTVLAGGTNLTNADMTGLSLSIAGAVASNKIYASMAALGWAVRKFNASSVNVTTADGSIKRAVPHDTIGSGVAVCPPVAGSVLGADLGAYSVRTAIQNTTNFPTGLCPFEVRSLSGLPSTDVRFRGRLSEGGSSVGKSIPNRFRMRGITIDSTGVTATADNTAMDQAGQAETTQPTELGARYLLRVDTVIREVDPAALSTSAAAAIAKPGYTWDRRVAHYDPQSGLTLSGTTASHGGQCAALGSRYDKSPGLTGVRVGAAFTTAVGCYFRNVQLASQGGGTAGSGGIPTITQRVATGIILYNVYATTDETNPSNALIGLNTTHPVRKGAGICMVFGHYPSAATVSSTMFAFGNDAQKTEADGFIIQHLGGDSPLLTDSQYSDARLNFAYNDNSDGPINKEYFLQYCAVRNWNNKHGSFFATENVPTTAWNATDAYYAGVGVVSSSICYQAIRDVPASSGILVTDATYWMVVPGRTAGSVWGPRSGATGNLGTRYHVGFRGNVGSGTFNADSAPGNPVPALGAATPLGAAWGSDEQYNALYSQFYTTRGTDYRAKSGGPLVNRVSANAAVTPYYLSLTNAAVPLRNDGTDPAGAFEAVGVPVAAAGAMALTGTVAVSTTAAIAVAGTMALSGAVAMSPGVTVSVAGAMVLGGSVVAALKMPFAAAGAMTMSGSVTTTDVVLPYSWTPGDLIRNADGTALQILGRTIGTACYLTGPAVTAGYIQPNSPDPTQMQFPVKGPNVPPVGATILFTAQERGGNPYAFSVAVVA